MKRSYLLLIAAVLVAAIIWIVEKPYSTESDFKPFLLIPELNTETVSKINVTHLLSGSELYRDGAGWKIKSLSTEMSRQLQEKEGIKETGEKKSFKADKKRVEKALNILKELKAVAIVSTNPEKQAIYQVSKIGKKVVIYGSDGKKIGDIIIGKNGPEMYSTYVRVAGEDQVYLVTKHIGPLIPADVMTWRDRAMWSLSPEEIVKVSIKKGSDFFQIQRDEDGFWHLGEIDSVQLESVKVNTFVGKIADLKAARFASVINKKETGLLNPRAIITVWSSAGKEYKLLVGDANAQGYIYAELDGGEEIYLMKSDFFSKIPTSKEL